MQRIETEYTIRKKRDRQLYNITISARNRNKFNLQKKLEIFSIDQKDEIQRMEDKYSSILQKYIDKKTIDYRKKCEQEIEKLSDPVQKREKYRSPSHNNLLNKLLILLQTFVRLSDTDDKGRGLCISCGKKIHRRNAHGGHFISRLFKSVCLSLFNINLQCSECNYTTGVLKGTEEAKKIEKTYRDNLIEKHGIDIVMDLEKTVELELSNPCKFGSVNIYFIKEQLEYYTPIVKQMILDKQTTEQTPAFNS